MQKMIPGYYHACDCTDADLRLEESRSGRDAAQFWSVVLQLRAAETNMHHASLQCKR
jgi:hypothetical protein